MAERALNAILDDINTTIKTVSFGSKITTRGLCYLQVKDEKTFPIENKDTSNALKISWEDKYPLQIYHRILEVNKETDPAQGFGKNASRTRVYSMRLVGVGSKTALSAAGYEDNQEIAKAIADAIPAFISSKEYAEVTGMEVIKQEVYDSEWAGVEIKKLSLEGVAFWVDYELRLANCGTGTNVDTSSTVRNSDSSYSDSVGCGQVLVLPDITITQADDTTVDVPSVQDIDVDDYQGAGAVPGVSENTDQSYQENVGAGQTVVIPDVDLTDYDEINLFSIISAKDLRMADISASETIPLFTGLTSAQDGYIADFIGAEIFGGNWFNSDSFYFFPMGATNGVIDWHGLSNATPRNSPTWGANGVTLDGSDQDIDTNFDPNVDAVNFKDGSNSLLCFCYDNLGEGSDFKAIFGNGLSGNKWNFYQRPLATRVISLSQGLTTSDFGTIKFEDQTLHGMSRFGLKAGAHVKGSNGASWGIGEASGIDSGTTFKVGQRGDDNWYLNFIASSFNIGSSGVEAFSHDANLRTLMTAWGVTLA